MSAAMSEYILKVKNYTPTDPRLGRHVRHDSRSLSYLAPEKTLETLVSKRHSSAIPTLDQGDLGSCVGNAGAKVLSYSPFWSGSVTSILSTSDANADETYAVGLYSAATAIDSAPGTYPPTDTGSDGLSVAKVLSKRGLISGYQHATSLNAVLTALASRPVITGTDWRNDMFTPDSDGRIHITGDVAGGHEYVLDEVDFENERIWMQNSWGTSWGVNGRGYYTFSDYEALLRADGDVTVLTPLATPAPAPSPAPVLPDADQVFAERAQAWLNGKPFFYRSTLQRWLKAWLDARSL